MSEIVSEVLDWVEKRSAPNSSYKYSRCVVCGHAWWDNNEQHNFDCWVPRLKRLHKNKTPVTTPPAKAAGV